MAGTQRYWDGAQWTDHAAPLSPVPNGKKSSSTNLVVAIALGVLLAAGAIWVVYSLSQPSDADCAIQRLEFARGDRAAWDVDDACK